MAKINAIAIIENLIFFICKILINKIIELPLQGLLPACLTLLQHSQAC